MKKLHFLPVFLFSLIILLSCRHDPEFLNDIEPICFQEQVLPVLQNSCGISGCHDGVSDSEANEYFSPADYESVMRVVTPGDAEASTLYKVITDIHGEDFMPPDNPLSQEQRTIIHVWIEQGAENTSCDTQGGNNKGNKDTVTFVQDILPILRSSCGSTGCHDELTREEDYIFTSYESIIKTGTVRAFEPDESKMIEVITESESDDKMPPPPLPSLSDEQVSKLRKWISEGALNSDFVDNSCDTTGTIGFVASAWPVIQTNCVGCHNNTATNGNVNLNGYDNVRAQASIIRNGVSLLSGVISHTAGFIAMPPNGKINDCEIRIIELWTGQGMLNN